MRLTPALAPTSTAAEPPTLTGWRHPHGVPTHTDITFKFETSTPRLSGCNSTLFTCPRLQFQLRLRRLLYALLRPHRLRLWFLPLSGVRSEQVVCVCGLPAPSHVTAAECACVCVVRRKAILLKRATTTTTATTRIASICRRKHGVMRKCFALFVCVCAYVCRAV